MKVRRAAVLVFCAAVCAAIAAGAVPAYAYYNVVNEPFATVSNGPQNALIVDVARPQNATEVQKAVDTLLQSNIQARRSRDEGRLITFLRNGGLLGKDEAVTPDATVLVRSGGKIQSPENVVTRAYGSGDITFTYTPGTSTTPGWDATDLETLKRLQGLAIPVIDQVYGKPASSVTVKVTRDDALSDRDAIAGGVLVLNPATGPEIRLPHYRSLISLERSFLHMMIHCYHIGAAFQYDAWEEGFTRAASVVVAGKVDPQLPQELRLDLMGQTNLAGNDALYYLMSSYEIMNQPALGNNVFFTNWSQQLQEPNTLGGMIIPRLGMVSTAWLKVYIERLLTDGQSFFKLFNETYYNALNQPTGTGLPGSVPELKDIATTIAPTVEGQSFGDWYSNQYVLDTSVSQGRKLYVWAVPQIPETPDTEGYSMPTTLLYFSTDASGSETPLSGTSYPVYWNYDYTIDLPIGSQYEAVPITSGQGTVDPTFYVANLGGEQRVTIDFAVTGASQRIYAPIGLTGTTADPNAIYGVVVGANDGTVDINADVGQASVKVTRGGFGAALGGDVGVFGKLTITYNRTGADPAQKLANVGPGSYVAVVEATPATKTVTNTYPPGYNMISLPLTPFATDHAEALGGSQAVPAIDPAKLLLSRWDGSKYYMYPNIPPFKSGFGYWAKFPVQTTVKVTGRTVDTSVDYRIPLVYGWNQVGTPFEAPALFSNLKVEYANNDPVTMDIAWINGLVGRYVWKYAPTQAGSPYALTNTLEPWQGYWVNCLAPEGVVLIVPHP